MPQVSLAAEVALAYLQLRGQQSQLTIAQTNLASQQETLQLTDWRAQAGLTTSLEVEQARTSVEQTRAEIPEPASQHCGQSAQPGGADRTGALRHW